VDEPQTLSICNQEVAPSSCFPLLRSAPPKKKIVFSITLKIIVYPLSIGLAAIPSSGVACLNASRGVSRGVSRGNAATSGSVW
jgi:hypothetical protein